MSDINVVSRTQHINIEPVTGTVTVINAGPMGPAGPPGGVTLEDVRDDLANVLVAGPNIIITPDDLNDTITIEATGAGVSGLTLENVRDDLANVLQAGSNITITVNDAADTITISSAATSGVTLEQVRDDLASVLVAGSNVTITPDDLNDTITIAATGSGAGGYNYVTDETSPPATPAVGETWFAPDTGNTYLRYDSGGTPVWLQSATSSGSVGIDLVDGGDASTVF